MQPARRATEIEVGKDDALLASARAVEGGVERRGWTVMAALCLGYVGIYLCRKNLAVALPMLQDAFHQSKAEVGTIASVGTLAYAAGKIANGPIVDRIGGRRGFLLAIVVTAVFGAAGAFAPSIAFLSLAYAVNRYAGSGGWGGMLKLVPSWFPPARTGTVVGVLSLSYLAGGVLATLLARQIVSAGGGWRAVMGLPSIAALVIALLCALLVRKGPRATELDAIEPAAPRADTPKKRFLFLKLFERPQFLITCALSFTVTLMRESFNTWSVDFLVSVQGKDAVAAAALQSTGFDLAGFVSTFAAGVAYDRIRPSRRRWLMSGSLALLALVLVTLPRVALASPWAVAGMLVAAGLLVYGPYSLLAGTLAVENGGPELAATAAGIIDGVGYIAGALAGRTLGWVIDRGGYSLGLGLLAVITAVSAAIALALHPIARAGDAARR